MSTVELMLSRKNIHKICSGVLYRGWESQLKTQVLSPACLSSDPAGGLRLLANRIWDELTEALTGLGRQNFLLHWWHYEDISQPALRLPRRSEECEVKHQT